MKEITIAKKSISIIMALMMISSLFIAAIPIAIAASHVAHIFIESGEVLPNETIELTIWAHNITDLHAWGVRIYFDPAVVKPVSGVWNPIFTSPGMGAIDIDVRENEVTASVMNAYRSGVVGAGHDGNVWMANFTFRAIGDSGKESILRVCTRLGILDPFVRAIPHTTSNGTVTILVPPVVVPPEDGVVPTLKNISIYDTTIVVNSTHDFNATPIPAGTPLVQDNVRWTVANDTVGTIDGTTGVFTARSAGTTIITARYGNFSVNAIATVPALPVTPLTGIKVSDATIVVGRTHRFSAAPVPAGAPLVQDNVRWTVANATVGTIDGTTGVFTARSAGTTTITARYGNFSVNAIATVPAPALVLTGIRVDGATIAIGRTHNFDATPVPAGVPLVQDNVRWTVVNATVGTIDVTTGVFTARVAGTTTITATYRGFSANAIATVPAPAAPEPRIPGFGVIATIVSMLGAISILFKKKN